MANAIPNDMALPAPGPLRQAPDHVVEHDNDDNNEAPVVDVRNDLINQGKLLEDKILKKLGEIINKYVNYDIAPIEAQIQFENELKKLLAHLKNRRIIPSREGGIKFIQFLGEIHPIIMKAKDEGGNPLLSGR